MFIYIKISNNLQFLALATVYGHLATVYYLLQKRAPTVNQIVQNGCLQFISFLGHYFTPGPKGFQLKGRAQRAPRLLVTDMEKFKSSPHDRWGEIWKFSKSVMCVILCTQ